jgi:hypothetical protein
MKITKDDKEFPESTILSYRILKRNGLLKITDFWRALSLVFGLKEFEILNLNSPHIFEFESYIMDLLIDWRNGEPIEFDNLENAIYSFGEFTEMEKLLFQLGNLQHRLWAIYLYLIDPNMNL